MQNLKSLSIGGNNDGLNFSAKGLFNLIKYY